MKIVFPIVGLVFFSFFLAAFAGEDFKFPIHQRVSGYGVTNTWCVSMRRLTNMPAWSERGEPPLSVGKATLLAKYWIVSKGGSTNSYVLNVEFHSVAPGAHPSTGPHLRPCWFYIIRFHEVYQYGSGATCVV